MPYSKQVYLTAIILYTILSFIFGTIFKIPYIDIFTGLMVCGIFYQVLDWKYGDQVQKKEDN